MTDVPVERATDWPRRRAHADAVEPRRRLHRPASRGCRTAIWRSTPRTEPAMLALHRRAARAAARLRRGGLPDAARGRRRARLRPRRRATPSRSTSPASRARCRSRGEVVLSTHLDGGGDRVCGPTRASFLESDACSRPRQELLLAKVVEGFNATGQPVGSKALAADPDVTGRPVDHPQRARGARGAGPARASAHLRRPRADRRRLPLLRRPAAARASARPQPRAAALARAPRGRRGDARDDRDAVAGDQPAGDRLGAADRHHDDPPRRGPAAAAAGADGRGHHLDRRRLQARVHVRPAGRPGPGRLGRRPTSTSSSSGWASARGCSAPGSTIPACSRPSARSSAQLAPAFTELAQTAENTLYVDGAARLLSEHRFQDVSQLNELLEALERRVSLLGRALAARSTSATSTCGSAARTRCRRCARCRWWPATTACRSATSGTVSVIGPMRMDYARAIMHRARGGPPALPLRRRHLRG